MIRALPWAAVVTVLAHVSSLRAQDRDIALPAALTSWTPYEAGGVRLLLDPELPTTAQPALWAGEVGQAQQDLARRLNAPLAPLPPILLVASRARLHALTGFWAHGLTDYQAPALFFVDAPVPNRLAVRHELGHWIPAQTWHGPFPPEWIAEGVAMWAQGTCSGYSLRAAAATLGAASRLPNLTDSTLSFRSLPELPAHLAAGSLVTYLYSLQPGLMRILWRQGLPGVTAALETDLLHLFRDWQGWLAAVPDADRAPLGEVAEACTT